MAGLSAAELQKRHGLEGAPDPFPAFGGESSIATSAAKSSPAPTQLVDTNSESAFPSLGGPAPSAAPATKWSSGVTNKIKAKAPSQSAAGGVGRVGAASASSFPASLSFSVPSASIPANISETLRKIKETTGCSVEASTQMKTGLKTFLIRGETDKKVKIAQRLIERGASKVETITVDVPVSTLGTIIGPKGTTLKSITDATACKIDIPKRDQLPSVPVKTNGHSGDSDSDSDAEPEDPLVAISLTGPTPSVLDAKKRILALIHTKVSSTSVSIKDIPGAFYPFIAGPKGSKIRQLESEVGGDQVQVHVPPPAIWKALEKQSSGEAEAAEPGVDGTTNGDGLRERKRDLAIKVKGDKEMVAQVVAEIRKRYEYLRDNSRTLQISIPKRQHRFLIGPAADDILEKHGCIVELTAVDDTSDQCTIRGPAESVVPALSAVMEKANAIAVEVVDVVAIHRSGGIDALAHAKNALKFLLKQSKLRQIAEAHSTVKVYPPFTAFVESSGTVVIEIVGEDRAEVNKAKEKVLAEVKALAPVRFLPVEIDYAVHKFVIGKNRSKISQFETAHSVTAIFPAAAEQSNTVILVITASLESLPADKKQRDVKVKQLLAAASSALSDLATQAADIKTATLDVAQKWHRFVIGPSGSVLRSILGEDSNVMVNLGRKDSGGEQDVIVVRGPSTEVDRVVPLIMQTVEDAKNDDAINGHTIEFSVEKRHVPHLVGSAGSAINKLKEALGVRVQFDDQPVTAGKQPSVKCTITGRKESIAEAKARMQAQIERLADETTETIVIKKALHSALIGQSGKYAIRLEEKYGVKITFPREGKDGASTQKPDEVILRGGRKGVAGAKSELLEAAEFESASNQTTTFSIPTASVARVLGKAGSMINSIKDSHGCQIDIEKSTEEKTEIVIKGDKAAIAATKAAILAVVAEHGEQANLTVTVENKYHRTLIGQGGQKLRDLIVASGGPEDQSKQSGLVNFPRNGDANVDEVRLRGPKALITKIKAELEKAAAALADQVVLGVVVPITSHATRIGRGGSALMDLQKKTGATIQFPGSRQYAQAGAIENEAELGEVDPKELVKVIGSKSACAQAIEILATPIATPASRSQTPQNGRQANSDLPSKSVSIANKYYYAVGDGGNLGRALRQIGCQVELPTPAPARAQVKQPEGKASAGAKEARIDAPDEGPEGPEYTFETFENYEGLGEDGEAEREWVIRGKEEVLEQGEKVLRDALERAKAASQVGVIFGLREHFGRIVGAKGATVSRLRAETGADITVAKDSDMITIVGEPSMVSAAKDAIVSIATRSGGPRY